MTTTKKMNKRSLFIGAILFSLGLGCGNAADSASVNADTLAVAGSSVNGEQLALPDANGPCAKDGSGPMMPSELDMLTKLLGLTSDEIAQIEPIIDATRTALENLRAQVKAGTVSPSDAKAQVKALHDSQKTQILALLTPDQQAKFSALRDHHNNAFDLTKLTDVLGLSSDQVSQISAIQSATEAKLNDIHSQVEAGTLSPDDAKTQLDQIRADTKAAIEAVLTADQKALLDKICASMPKPGGPGPGPGAPPPPPPPGGATGGSSGGSGGSGSTTGGTTSSTGLR